MRSMLLSAMSSHACSVKHSPAKFGCKSKVSTNVIFENRLDGVPVFRASLFCIDTNAMPLEGFGDNRNRKKERRWNKSVVTLDLPPPPPKRSYPRPACTKEEEKIPTKAHWKKA